MFNRSRHFVVCAVATLLFASASAHAQKPTLTKSVDEPGRTPYFDASAAPCVLVSATVTCAMTFAPVPAGFRLVVTWAEYELVAEANEQRYAYLGAKPSLQWIALPNAAQIPNSLNNFTLSTAIVYYIEPGAAPILNVYNGVLNSYVFGSVTGYLVAVP